MIRSLLRFTALVVVCILLVYAPELYKASGAPYPVQTPRRVLLRVALCIQNPDLENSALKALRIYMKDSPGIHLRIFSVSPEEFPSFSTPVADVIVFDGALYPSPDCFVPFPQSNPTMRHIPFIFPESGLLCGVCSSSPYQDAAFSMLSAILPASSLDADTGAAL